MDDKKILLILGASSDIGQALIEEEISEYDLILAHYRSNETIIENMCAKYDGKVVGYQADLGEENEVRELILAIKRDGYSPDAIVYLPAVSAKPIKFHKDSYERYKKNMAVGVDALVLILQAFLPEMAKRKKGKVLFMLSAYIAKPVKGEAIYICSKYAVYGLMKALSHEYADKNIQINAVSPEMIETKFLSDISDHIIEESASESPMGRNLLVQDVIPTIRYLLSKDSDCVTGQNIVISGGK